jgi:hypothetical protein
MRSYRRWSTDPATVKDKQYQVLYHSRAESKAEKNNVKRRLKRAKRDSIKMCPGYVYGAREWPTTDSLGSLGQQDDCSCVSKHLNCINIRLMTGPILNGLESCLPIRQLIFRISTAFRVCSFLIRLKI